MTEHGSAADAGTMYSTYRVLSKPPTLAGGDRRVAVVGLFAAVAVWQIAGDLFPALLTLMVLHAAACVWHWIVNESPPETLRGTLRAIRAELPAGPDRSPRPIRVVGDVVSVGDRAVTAVRIGGSRSHADIAAALGTSGLDVELRWVEDGSRAYHLVSRPAADPPETALQPSGSSEPLTEHGTADLIRGIAAGGPLRHELPVEAPSVSHDGAGVRVLSRAHAVWSCTGLPARIDETLHDRLLEALPPEATLSLTWRRLTLEAVRLRMYNAGRHAHNGRYSLFRTWEDGGGDSADGDLEESKRAFEETKRDGVAYGSVTLTATLSGSERQLDEADARLRAGSEDGQATWVRETMRPVPAWLGRLPGHDRPAGRRVLLLSAEAAACLVPRRPPREGDDAV